MNTNKLLYIGLNGFAGSGKDTVAKMIKTILNHDWKSLEECKNYYKSLYNNPTISATYNKVFGDDQRPVLCIAFADQLKTICSNIFGIPVERFYQNKETAWICINKKFQYTELKPEDMYILTAEDYYDNIVFYKQSTESYWMTLREILVYVGTYVLQSDINKQIFVNIVRNTISQKLQENPNLKYVIVTDVRFNHELEYIRENNGITMTITRNDVTQLNNIAEHDLDDVDDYDYIIQNNKGYDDLFEYIWNLLHNDIQFSNITVDLYTRDNINNYLRLIKQQDNISTYKLCSPFGIQKVYHNLDKISMIDPLGGPSIILGEKIEGTNLVPQNIEIDENSMKFFIDIDDKYWDKVSHLYV